MGYWSKTKYTFFFSFKFNSFIFIHFYKTFGEIIKRNGNLCRIVELIRYYLFSKISLLHKEGFVYILRQQWQLKKNVLKQKKSKVNYYFKKLNCFNLFSIYTVLQNIINIKYKKSTVIAKLFTTKFKLLKLTVSLVKHFNYQ